MKMIFKKFLMVVLFLCSVFVYADDPLPEPEDPPNPPALPIDENLMFLLIAGVVFGIYAIYRYKLKTKASV